MKLANEKIIVAGREKNKRKKIKYMTKSLIETSENISIISR
jgi:hypothetical protein